MQTATLQAGELRHRVTIRSVTETKTTRGGFATPSTTDVQTRIPAFVEPLTGRELDRAMQIDPRLRYQVTLRYQHGIQPRQMLIYHAFDGDHTFEIVQPPQIDEKRRTMVLMCGEAAA